MTANPGCVHGDLPWHCPDCPAIARAKQVSSEPLYRRSSGGGRWSTLFPRDDQWAPSYVECVVGD
jgi:hypothetical protein